MRAVNLIPADQRSGAAVGLGRSQGAAYAVLAIVGALALLAYLYGSARHQISSSRAQAATVQAQTQQAQSDAGSLAQYEALNATREKRQKAVEQLIESRFDWAHALHEVGRVLPSGVSVASLTGAIGAAATTPASASSTAASPSSAAAASSTVTSATPPGSVPSFTLDGCARTQTEVARTLERLRLIDGVKEVTLQSSSTSGGVGAGGGCPAGAPSFAAAITFAPLPPESAYAAKTVADRGSAAPGADGGTK